MIQKLHFSRSRFVSGLATAALAIFMFLPESATPNSGQFNAISTSEVGTTFSINSGMLEYIRTGASVGTFSRTTDFSPVPSALLYKVTINVSGNTVAQTSASVFQIGSGFGTTNSDESNTNTFARFAINFSATDGTWQIRDITNSTKSSNLTGSHNITWALNNSGSTITYLAPDGSTESLANDVADIWAGTTKIFDDITILTSTQTISDLKFAFTQGTGTIQIDNILIDPIPATITSFTPDNSCANSGATVTITGTNFTGATSVKFNGTEAASYTVASTTSITAVLPAGATTGPISVTTPLGIATSSSNFTINSPIITSQPTPVIMCSGTIRTFSVVTSAPSPTYQWQYSVDNSTWNNITDLNITYMTGELSATLSANNPVSQSSYYVRCVVTNLGCSTNSNSALLTVNGLPIITTQPANQTVCAAAGTATFTVAAGGSALSYQWQEYISGWLDITTGGIYAGATSPTLTITNPTVGMNNYKYRCQVTGGICSPPAASDGLATLTVNQPATPTITAVGDLTFCAGGSVALTSSIGITYLWSNSASTASINVNASGNYTVQVTDANGCLSAASDATVVLVKPLPTVTASVSPASVCNPGAVVFSATPSAGTVTWYDAVTGGNTVTNLNPAITTTTTYYAEAVNDGCASTPRTAVTAIVGADLTAITTQPSNQIVCDASGVASFTVIATGVGLTYQWQEYTTITTSWNPVANGGVYSGVISTTLTITNPAIAMNGNKYRCIVTGACSVLNTDGNATLTVNPLPAKPTIAAGGPLTFCAPGSVTLTSSTSSGYLWSNAATTENINVTTSGSYTVKVTDGNGCQSAASDATIVTVDPLPVAVGAISGATTVALGQTGVSYSVGAIANATTYTWAYTPASGVTINQNGTTSPTLDFLPGATSGTLTVHGNNACGIGTDASLGITVSPLPISYTVSGSGSYCSTGTGLTVTLNNSETGVDYVLWKNGSATSNTLPGSTGSPINFTNQLAGTYTIKGTNGSGTASMSGSAVITAVAPPTAYAGATGSPGNATVGVPYLLSAATASSYTTLVWSNSASGNFSSSSILQPTFTGLVNGPVTLTLTASNATCLGSDAVASIYLYMWPPSVINTYTWTGAASTAWETPGNWSSTPTFTQFDDIIIPSTTNKPIISSAASCNNLTIYSGAVLTINASSSLTVAGTLINNSGNSGLVVQSGGSLIENSTGVAATVERYIPTTSWHLISPPISNAVSNVFTGHYLREYNPATGYIEIKDLGVPLTAAEGYAVKPTGAFTSSYAGTLNSGSYNLNLYSGSDFGWNLVGNPYPSTINWDAPQWTKTNVAGSIYIENGGGWATYVNPTSTNGGSPYIAPTQGFFVKATPGLTASLGMTPAVQTHQAATFLKSAEEVVPNLVRLQVSGNGYKDEAVVRFAPEATSEFDIDYDAYKFFGKVPESAQLYTLGSIALSINSLPETEIVPVGIHIGTSGNYTIAATEINDLNYVTIEDMEAGVFTPLSSGSYAFKADAGDFQQRFKLHFSTLSVEESKKVSAIVYSHQQTVHINMVGQEKGDILIYNISGQQIATKLAAQGTNEIKLPSTGNYIVKVVTKNNIVVRKVFIQ